MFWRFGGHANISTLDQILDKPDGTLEEVLDDSDMLQELKAANAKLVDFLRDETNLRKLLKMVIAGPDVRTEEPSIVKENEKEPEKLRKGFFSSAPVRSKSTSADAVDEKAERQRQKMAYMACEVLSSDIFSIYETLLEDQESLREFWQYLNQDAPLDVTQAGYFTKVNEALLEKKTEDMLAFIKSLDDAVANMMKHVDCPLVMDLLLKLISLEKDAEGQGIADWLQSKGLIPLLIDYINPKYSAATQTSAGDFLKAIITISANATGQDASVIGPNELTRQLVSRECVQKLCNEMLNGGNPLTVGVGIVIEVIRKNNSDYDSDSQIGPEPKSTDPIYLGTLLRIFAHHIHDFTALILSRKHTVMTEDGAKTVERKDLKVAWGESIEPLGFDRFKTCELMAELLHCSNMGLLNERGSETAIAGRDIERERLKAEGRLAAAPAIKPSPSHQDFGQSVDSSGFHHAEDFTPLGESPEDLKVHNADDEDFEKVALSEAENTEGGADSSSESELDQLTRNFEHAHTTQEEGGGVGGGGDTSTAISGSLSDDDPPRTPTSASSSKRSNVSLLSQQLQAAKDQKLNPLSSAQPSSDVPAPLFANRAAKDPSDRSVIEDTHAQTQPMGDVQTPDESSSESPKDFESELDGSPVVGDLLKMKFVEHRVVPTILDFFFRFPWNNFLHNVVYDVVQQVFNGSMDRGYNRSLAVDLFQTGRITQKIIEGQNRSDKAQEQRRMRLGYMGHLTLIAEEVVKFTERQPPELLSPQVIDKIMDPDWIHYVEQTLTDTRDRDNAILGGVRPDAILGPRQAVLNAVQSGQFGNTGSNALANAGLGGGGYDSLDLANAGNAAYGSGNLLSGFGSSDDEDDEELDDNLESEQVSNDQDQQADEQVATSLSADKPPSIPAPLAIPPSRARRQLAVRLAERQAALNASETSNSTESTSSPAPHETKDDSSRLADHIRSQAEAEGMYGHSSDEGEEHHDAADDEDMEYGRQAHGDNMRPAPLTRQTTTEAASRRPLDVGDEEGGDEDEDEQAEALAKSAASPRVGSSSRGGGGSAGGVARNIQWGDDSDSDDDQPVEMGRKAWMMRRSSSQGSLNKD